jgi:hypothetical protein
MDLLVNILKTPIPSSYDEQLQYMKTMKDKLSSYSFLGEVDGVHDEKVLPRIVARLRSTDMSRCLEFFTALYNHVQCSSPKQRESVISWLQPPADLLASATFFLEPAKEAYKQILASVPAFNFNEDDIEQLQATSVFASHLKKQAIVPSLKCDVSEMCEFIWRAVKDNVEGVL